MISIEPNRRCSYLLRLVACALVVVAIGGCVDRPASEQQAESIWGQPGITPGRLQKPRAMAIDKQDRLYIVDMTARIQVFDTEGTYLRGWKTPISKNGRPSGLTIDDEGQLLVADTHYYRVLVYDDEGTLDDSATVGGTKGREPGEFGFVTDAVKDSQGNLYVAEYGDFDRIQKFSPDGTFLLQWGAHGAELGQFRRPQNLAIDQEDRIWVVDACNHRIQVFNPQGELLLHWGSEGSAPGELYYPYDLAFDGKGHLYVCEYGNHRVQKFTLDGKSIGCWGKNGRAPGELHNPWALVLDSAGSVYVLDTNNHRVQRFRL